MRNKLFEIAAGNKVFRLLFLLLFMLLIACGDLLNNAPDGRQNYKDIFGDNVRTGAYLNSCYDYIGHHGVSYNFWTRGPACWSDEAWNGEYVDGGLTAEFYNGSGSASSHPIANGGGMDGSMRFDGNYWEQYWAAIRKCTFFLTNIDQANVTLESDRQRWKAEAHILRAYYYSELLRWFGCGLPIIRDEVYDWTTDFSAVKRASYYEVVKFIIEDCDAAIECEDLPWRISLSNEAGRMNKATAWAIKSRMILYAASPLYNNNENHWEEAYTITKKAMEELSKNGYELYKTISRPGDFKSETTCLPNDFAALYNEYFVYDKDFTGAPVDKETIFQKKPTGMDGMFYGNIWNVDGIGAQDGWITGTCPSQELVDSYETTDGEPVLDLTRPYNDDKHLGPNYNSKSIYDPQNPYANRDPRFYASIYYNGSKRYTFWKFDEEPGCVDYPAGAGFRTRTISTYVGEPKTGIHQMTSAHTRTGYYHRKFLHPTCGNSGPIVQAAAAKLFRYGEVLLNFAEAAAETGNATYMAEAWAAVNEIRSRVGMPQLPESLKADKEMLILRIRNERRVELAFEEHRYFDVRRWTKPDENLAPTDRWVTAMQITRNPDNSFTYERIPVKERLCYTNKFLRLPLPLREVNIIIQQQGENWQNPGW